MRIFKSVTTYKMSSQSQSSTFPSSQSPFHHLPTCDISLLKTPLTEAAHAFILEHTSLATANHCLRSACFALLLVKRIPNLSDPNLDAEAVVLSALLHDIGWATDRAMLSKDTRFEVDGANIARNFIQSKLRSESAEEGAPTWDKHRLQLVWDAIALHTSASIAAHKEPEVAATQFGISVDFVGPYFPPGSAVPGTVISVDEYKEIIRAFPFAGFKEDFINTMCFLCREKPATTFDNFVSRFGCEFGLDGQGTGKQEYQAEAQVKGDLLGFLLGGLDRCAEFEDK